MKATTKWMDIETAPKDGTAIMTAEFMDIWGEMTWIYAIEMFSNGRWSKSGYSGKPTHWTPLPDPPKDDTEATG